MYVPMLLSRARCATSRQLPRDAPCSFFESFDDFGEIFFVHLRNRAADS